MSQIANEPEVRVSSSNQSTAAPASWTSGDLQRLAADPVGEERAADGSANGCADCQWQVAEPCLPGGEVLADLQEQDQYELSADQPAEGLA